LNWLITAISPVNKRPRVSPTHRLAAIGFLFGSFGLYLLAGLSLMSPLFEVVSGPLMAPGRALAARFAGPEGSNAEIAFLTLANGILYALVFVVAGWIVRAVR
jgi:hypothetical protein